MAEQCVGRPIILTLAMDDEAHACFDALRRVHFPPELNHIAAHLTLFHALPDEPEAVRDAVHAACEGREPFAILVEEVRSIGRGVVYRCRSEELAELRSEIAARFTDRLTRQDAMGFRPHVTVQNKVTPERAKETLAKLTRHFVPWEFTALGVELWHYVGGPWRPIGRVELTG